MNNKILLSVGILISCVYCNTSYAEKYIGSSSSVSKTMTYNEDLNIGASFDAKESIIVYGDLDLGSMSDIQKDLIVYGNLDAGSSISVGGNVIVTGDIKIGSSSDIKGYIKGKNIDLGSMFDVNKIYAANSLKIGSSSDIDEGIEVYGDAELGSMMNIGGYSKVTGKLTLGSSSDISGTIYIYKNALFGSSIGIKNGKIKIVKDITLGSMSDISDRVYIYGDKNYGSMIDEDINNFSGFMGEIDPLLVYSLSDSQIKTIQNNLNKYLSEAKLDSKNKYEIYTKMFQYLDSYIEIEDFDKEQYSKIKKQYIGEKEYITVIKSDTSYNTSITYSPVITSKLKIRLNHVFNKIPEDKKIVVYGQVIDKIDLAIIKLKKKEQTSKVVGKINLLLGIQNHVQSNLDSLNEDELLKEIGF